MRANRQVEALEVTSEEKADADSYVEVFVAPYGRSPLFAFFFSSGKQMKSSSVRRWEREFWRFEQRHKAENYVTV